jgi:predicted alpha/beta-hydrolase family hydrolase
MPEQMWVEITQKQGVTAIVCPAAKRDQAGITLILAHGAGAGQTSGFMTRFATELSARGITVVTFNFLYAELGRRIPDRNNILESCFRAVIEVVRKRIGTG